MPGEMKADWEGTASQSDLCRAANNILEAFAGKPIIHARPVSIRQSFYRYFRSREFAGLSLKFTETIIREDVWRSLSRNLWDNFFAFHSGWFYLKREINVNSVLYPIWFAIWYSDLDVGLKYLNDGHGNITLSCTWRMLRKADEVVRLYIGMIS